MKLASRVTSGIALLAALLLLPTGVASAQGYGTPDESLTISSTVLSPGDEFSVTGTGFDPGSEVQVVFNSTPVVLGTIEVSSTGTATGTFRVPADAEVGAHRVEMVGVDPSGAPRTLSVEVTVTGATAAPADERPASGLAFTGATTLGLVGAGVAALVIGTTMVRFRRRRAGLA